MLTQLSSDDLAAGGIVVQALAPNHSETVVEARGLTQNHCETVVEARGLTQNHCETVLEAVRR